MNTHNMNKSINKNKHQRYGDGSQTLLDLDKAINQGLNIQFSAIRPGNYHVRFVSKTSGIPFLHWYPRKQSLWQGRTPIRKVNGNYPTLASVIAWAKAKTLTINTDAIHASLPYNVS